MSNVIVRIPAPLRGFTEGRADINADGATVGEIMRRVGDAHPELLPRVLKADGQPREFVNLYLGSDNVQALQGMGTPVSDGDILSILPAVAGGGA